MQKKQILQKVKGKIEMEKEQQILKNVRKGYSINSQAKKYDMSWDTVKALCNKYNISSKHTHIKATQEAIIEVLAKSKVATTKEISSHFNLSTHNYQRLRERLQSMVRRGKIQRIKLPTFKSLSRNGIFKGYTETYLFYIDDEGLRQWIIQQIPTGMPLYLRKVVTQCLHGNNIDIDLSHITPTKTISFTEDEYNKIKQKAKEKQMGIKEVLLHGI